MAAKSAAQRILQVVHGFPPEGRGGTESYVFESTLALRAAGLDVSVLCGTTEPRTPAALSSTRVSGIPVTRLHRSGLFVDNWEKSYDPAAAALFDALLVELQPDVVHVHHWIRLTRNLVEIAAARGIPAVVTLHDAATSCPRVFRVRDEKLCHLPLSTASCLSCVPRTASIGDSEASIEIESYREDFERELRLAAAVLVPSRSHQDFLSRELGKPPEFFQVVPHGRLERGRPSGEKVPRLSSRIRLGYWGHLTPLKGYHLLLEALHELSDRERERFEVVCFGTASDPAYRKRLDALSEGLSVTEIGPFTPKDLNRIPFDVAVIPSIASESFSFVLDEAFELGVPAVVSDRGALAERLGDAGITFEPESPRSLASRLRKILQDPAVLVRWAAAIPGLVPMKDHAALLRRIYREVTKRKMEPVPVDPAVTAARLERLGSRLEERTQALERATDEAKDQKLQLGRKEEDLAAFGKSVADHKAELERREQALADFEKSVAEHHAELTRKDSALAGFEKSTSELRSALEERARTAAEAEQALAREREEAMAREREQVTARESLQASLDEQKRTLDTFRESVERHRDEISALEQSVAQHQAALSEREAALGAFQKSTKELREEVARREQEVRAQTSGRAEAEAAWKRDLAEHQRSLELHAEALSGRQRELEHQRARWLAVSEDLVESRRKVSGAVREARSIASELAILQAAAATAKLGQARAEEHAALLESARSEEQKEISAWRTRTNLAEAAVDAVRKRLAWAETALVEARAELQDASRAVARSDEEARRIAELHEKGAAALVVPGLAGGDRVARAEALVGAVLEQHAKLEEVRAWLEGGTNGHAGPKEVLRRLDALPRRLRILLVIHDFLPYHAAGSEVYTFQLAQAFSSRHDVELLFCENRPDRPQYETRRGAYEGIPFTEVVHHAAFPDFRSTYVDPRMEERFEEVLDRFHPDVVHVQHTKFFGVGILEKAARRGIPIVYTLHEYMLLCSRDGQMLQASLERCDLPEPGKCAECLGEKLVESGPLARGAQRVGRGLAKVLPGPLKQIGTRLERRSAVRHAAPVEATSRRRLMVERDATVRRALSNVDLFLAPSEFLRKTFVASGFVDEDRIVISRYGQDLSRFQEQPRKRSATLRVGYLGTVAAYKGVHVLVEALNRLAGHPVEGRIHGVTEFFPDFVRDLEAHIRNPRVKLLGRYENKDVGRILSEMDVLVVPSLWWENSPITIHEAFLAGVPVVASDQGGMAELVEDGKNGFLFKIGDAADLARVLLRFVADPKLVEKLRPRRETIRDIREDALWTEDQYRRLIAAKAAR